MRTSFRSILVATAILAACSPAHPPPDANCDGACAGDVVVPADDGPSGAMLGAACGGSAGPCVAGLSCLMDDDAFPRGYCTTRCEAGAACPSGGVCLPSP